MIEHTFENMRRYTPGKQPYVEVTDGDRQKTHARIIGWDGDLIFIQYPSKVTAQMNKDPMDQVRWIHKNTAQRIRRADSIFASTEDDHEWHEEADKHITYRGDPWTVTTQQAHEAGGQKPPNT